MLKERRGEERRVQDSRGNAEKVQESTIHDR